MKKLLIITSLFLIGCSPNNTEPLNQNSDFIGLSVQSAEVLAQMKEVPFRVVKQDGELLMVTEDFRPGRINATTENNIVTSYTTEGKPLKPSVLENCNHYFDGCNTCTRNEESGLSFCTKKACREYEEPKCLDQ